MDNLMNFDNIWGNNIFQTYLNDLYDPVDNYQQNRYNNVIKNFGKYFVNQEITFFSAPGRTEIGGNHTDHNNGLVIAASINMDTIAAAAKNNDAVINVYSDGFDELFKIDLNDLSYKDNEKGTSNAIIRGIACKFKQLGKEIGGFNAFISSNVLVGSGLSSSASFEILICSILNVFYNDNQIDYVLLAKIAQYSETNFFKKPCGLMDQIACAAGGIIAIDFKNSEKPLIEKINYNFEDNGYSIMIINSGGSHADLTEDYAAIPGEMKSVAAFYDQATCRNVNIDQIYNRFHSIKNYKNGRAFLRYIHYYEENKRVTLQINCLKKSDIEGFLKHVNDSGNSSWKWLQNVITIHDQDQSLALALAFTELFLKYNNCRGACWVHGGGFEGTSLNFIPVDKKAEYINFITRLFGKDSIIVLKIRNMGIAYSSSF